MLNYRKLKFLPLLAIVSAIGITGCVPKSFFTTETRKTLERDSISLNKLQFYVDRDVELRREVSSGNAKVSSGKVVFENGKYVHIIMLKRFTPGVCTKINANSIEVSFEVGDGKTLTFGVSAVASPGETYRLFANEWINQEVGKIGKIKYDNETYYIQAGGEGARLMINKSVLDHMRVEAKTMSGVKVQ